jgi:CRP-like cAMP-binding protein
MKLIIPLRAMSIATNCMLVVYGILAQDYPALVVNLAALPINGFRLREMLVLIRKVRNASEGDLSMDWLKPYMSRRSCKAGEVLFRKGDGAETMFYTLSGRFRLVETGIELGERTVVGELGLLAPDNRRTQTLECIEAGDAMQISYREVEELYFQNPEFGFYFLRLSSRRLFSNIARLEAEVARLRDAHATAAVA